MTKAQIDKLGERLRLEAVTESDLRLLDEYRRSFWNSYQEVMWVLRERGRGHLEPTGRFPKTPGSIVAKLTREPSIRLSQIQDIAGCRIVVPSVEDQMSAQNLVEGFFNDKATRVFDRRDRPSHGYRAVHIVVPIRGCPVEIQLRTTLQDMWAQLCEKLSDEFGADIKYGGGSDQIRTLLSTSSELVAKIERDEQVLFKYEADLEVKLPDAAPKLRSLVSEFRQLVEQRRAELSAGLQRTIALVRRDKLNGGTH